MIYFLKAMAEQLVQDEGHGLPICIVRPSIVVSTWKVLFGYRETRTKEDFNAKL